MSRQSWLSGAVGLALVLVGWASPASAQSAQEQTIGNIVDRLVRIEEDFGQWQRAIAEGGTIVVTDSEAMAAMNTRVADLSQDLADLAAQARSQDINLDEFAGRVGQFARLIEEFGTRLDNLVEAVDARLTALEEAEARRRLEDQALAQAREKAGDAELAAARAEVSSDDDGAAGVAAAGALPDGTPMERYDFARALLIQEDYTGAERAFRNFLDAHPADNLAGNAQYWLGETHYVRGEFEAAAREFLLGYERYPQSAKAPGFLLKLGMTLAALGQRAEACTTLEELAAQFPLVGDDIRRSSAEERAVLGCP